NIRRPPAHELNDAHPDQCTESKTLNQVQEQEREHLAEFDFHTAASDTHYVVDTAIDKVCGMVQACSIPCTSINYVQPRAISRIPVLALLKLRPPSTDPSVSRKRNK